jgi:alkylhydroperoxidase/carboxymuconolactone decarboxylase family protein YurZ
MPREDLFGAPAALLAASPATAAALRGLAHVVDDDGELPRWFKHLLVACVAALKRRDDETRRWVRSAIDAGASAEAVMAVAVDATLSRGVHVAGDLIDALAATGATPPVEPSSGQLAIDTAPDEAAIRSYFTEVFGAVPDRVALLMDHCFPAMAAYHLMRQAGLEDSVLPAHHLELVLVVLNAAEYQPLFVEVHARGARQKGASEAELVEACACAIPIAGVAAWLPASQGILASRPDTTGS